MFTLIYELEHQIVVILLLLGLAFILWQIDRMAHSKKIKYDEDVLSNIDAKLSLAPYHKIFKDLRFRKNDNLLAPFPFIWTYLLMIACILIFNYTSWIIIKIACIIFMGGKFRCLQEIGHYAIHASLCPSQKWGKFLTNIFTQFPLFLVDVKVRYRNHVIEHHPNPNTASKDPNLADFNAIGFVSGISRSKFLAGVFFPLTFRGIKEKITACVLNYATRNKDVPTFLIRNAVLFSIIFPFFYFGLYTEFILLYILPLIVVYPFFAWMSQVVEHRWYFKEERPFESKIEKEFAYGRPTDYYGVSGAIIRHLLFPFGDSYHLAHSLFPYVRWNYLPQVDKVLKQHCPYYTQHISSGIWIKKGNQHSALSELKERMVTA